MNIKGRNERSMKPKAIFLDIDGTQSREPMCLRLLPWKRSGGHRKQEIMFFSAQDAIMQCCLHF